MANLGSLVVSLEANIAKFESDLGRAVTMAEASMNKVSRAVSTAQRAFETLISAVAIEQVGSFAAGLVKATDELGLLSTRTGASVSALSAMKVIAADTGVDLETVASSLDKLQKNAFAAASGTGPAAKAFAALGFSSKDLAAGLKDPDAMFLQVAQRLAQFADDGNKTAVVMQLMGKGGDRLNAFLKELAVNGYTAANTTKAQADQAHAFEAAVSHAYIAVEVWIRDIVLGLLPAFETLKPALILAAELAGLFIGAFVIVKMATIAASLWSIAAAALAASPALAAINTSAGAAAAGMNVLVAAVAGFAIGTWLYNQFAVVRDVAAEMVYFYDDLWTRIKYGLQIALAGMSQSFVTWLHDMAESATKYMPLGGLFAKFVGPVPAIASLGDIDAKVAKLKEQRDAELALSAATIASIRADSLAAASPAAAAAKAAPTKHLHPPPKDDSAEWKRILDLEDRVIADAIKQEDAQFKLGNTQLDVDYKNSLVSLADYADQKSAMLNAHESLVLSLYDAEIAANSNHLAALAENDKAREAIEANIEKALAGRAQAETQIAAQRLADNEKAKAAQEAYAKVLLDVKKNYAALIGDTVLLAQLGIAERDDRIKNTLQVEGQTDSLNKLLAVEDDLILRSQKDPLSGIKVAVIDYSKAIADVAKQTQAMTTTMLKGMEDALVSFVTTGKMNFKGLIQSMISDLVRLQIQQQIMAPMSNWMSGLLVGGGSGSVFESGASVAADSAIAGFAGGGSFSVGGSGGTDTSLVQFRATPGEVVNVSPRGGGSGDGGGGPVVTYAPVINIDSRSDRAQIQADVQKIVQQGNAQLTQTLRRYNPGLQS